jgi:hypothetical protein
LTKSNVSSEFLCEGGKGDNDNCGKDDNGNDESKDAPTGPYNRTILVARHFAFKERGETRRSASLPLIDIVQDAMCNSLRIWGAQTNLSSFR